MASEEQVAAEAEVEVEETAEGVDGVAAEQIDAEDIEQLEAELAGVDEEAAAEAEEMLGQADFDNGASPLDLSDVEGADMNDSINESAVEGSMRLKRMLSRDDDDEEEIKRRKLDEEREPGKAAKVQYLLQKWDLAHDKVVQHVAETCTLEELEHLDATGYAPDSLSEWKPVAELFARHCASEREKKLPAGTMCDSISAFKFRWKLGVPQDKTLRGLNHKELRRVLEKYDGSTELATVVSEAKATPWKDDYTTACGAPTSVGFNALGRINRLELIDPVADCAVFGDANLTFSLKLAKHRKALHHVGRVIATTFEELHTLRERYQEVDDIIEELGTYFADVYHGVDCTRVAIDSRFKSFEGSLGAVYYNFPHSGAIQGFYDGHPVVNWRHENLMRLFFRALRFFMKPGGIVKVSSNMGAVGVRYSYIVGGALENEFVHIETVPFLEWHLHRYGRSYGDKRDIYKRPDAINNQSYNAQAADRDMVYCFAYAPTGKQMGPQQIRLPPNLKTLRACNDGPFRSANGPAKENLAKALHKRFVMEVSGTHVG